MEYAHAWIFIGSV